MKNPFKPEGHQDRDNPLVLNAVERPVERAMGQGRDSVINHPDRPGTIDRPGVDDGPGDRPGIKDSPADIARGRAEAEAPGVGRPRVEDAPINRPAAADQRSDGPRIVPKSATATAETPQVDLFPTEELAGYRTRWESIQTGFVDQPRAAVEQADALVSQVVTRLTEVFTRERSTLEEQWSQGDNASTEDLRIALTRYRSFFHRLLSM